MTEFVAPLDLTFLRAQTFADPVLEGEVLRLFLAQAREHIPRLVERSFGEQTASAHLLKGSCQGLGAGPLSDLLERYGCADADDRRRLDPELRHGLQVLAAAIEARLDAL